MFYAFFCAFLLIVPGMIATKITAMLKQRPCQFSVAYISEVLIYSFLILGGNVAVKFLLGGGSEVFFLTAPQMITLSIVKYIALSLVFAVLLPHVVLLAEMIESRLFTKRHDQS